MKKIFFGGKKNSVLGFKNNLRVAFSIANLMMRMYTHPYIYIHTGNYKLIINYYDYSINFTRLYAF